MSLIINTIKTEIRCCKNMPKQMKQAYKLGAELSKTNGASKIRCFSHGAKNVMKAIGPATSSLTVLGAFSPIPLGGFLGFGTGKLIDKFLKYLKILK